MENIRIYCENDKDYKKVPHGTSLKELIGQMHLDDTYLAALVDNQLKELDFKLRQQHNIRFIDTITRTEDAHTSVL